MLARFLDWLDEAAGGLIRITYLLAGMSAVASYFGAGELPRPVTLALAVSLPWLLAFSLETHTYLEARRLRAAWQELSASLKGSSEHARAWLEVRVHAGVLLVLIAFSAWNQLNYLATYWKPPVSAALPLPTPVAFLVRALIVPLAFLAAAFLAPMAPPLSGQIQAEARTTLAQFLKLLRSQRTRTLREVERSHLDLSTAIRTVSTAAGEPDAGNMIASVQSALMAIGKPGQYDSQMQEAPVLAGHIIRPLELDAVESHPTALYTGAGSFDGLASPNTQVARLEPPESSLSETRIDPDRGPTGPGSPVAARVRTSGRRKGVSGRPAVIQLDAGTSRQRRAAARATVEEKARAVYRSGMTVSELQRLAGISRGSASTWRRILDQESDQQHLVSEVAQ